MFALGVQEKAEGPTSGSEKETQCWLLDFSQVALNLSPAVLGDCLQIEEFRMDMACNKLEGTDEENSLQ